MVLSKFDSLSVRPPTPPRDLPDNPEEVDETSIFLSDPFGEKDTLPPQIKIQPLLNTPEQSPSSDITIETNSSSRRNKKVNFELQTCTIPANKAIAQTWTPSRSSPLRPLPQTRVSEPLKSILKPSDAKPTPTKIEPVKTQTWPEMLESIMKLLASSQRSSRLDGYHSLQRAMQAYDKLPNDQSLRQKMSLLTQFIQRDIQAVGINGAGFDSQLISQALKLLMALFRTTELVSAMTDEFCSFIVDRSIQVITDASMPKAIVNTHLAVIMQQNFRPRTMTTVRVEKILDGLDTILDRISGLSVQAYRIRIYKKFIQQRSDIMIKHTERWFKHLVRSLMTTQRDIHQSALDTAIIAARTVGHDRFVSKGVLNVLNRVRSDGESIATTMTREMEKMLDGDNADMVPQIWSVVTGLLRGVLQSSLFPAMKSWLELFEKCLNHNKEQVRLHAHVSFNFLVYAVNIGPNTAESWWKMFLNIPLPRFERRMGAGKAERDSISSAYFTLLYYALRPTGTFEQLDRYWTEFVVAFWTPLIHSSPAQQSIAACRLVTALLDGSRQPWNEHRALELRPQHTVHQPELPLLDPRWVRKSLSTILQFVELLLDSAPWLERETSDHDPIRKMWLRVLASIVEASSKEVMASTETKDAMAHIVNLIRRVWERHTTELALPQQKEAVWADKFCFLIESVLSSLGASRFADKCLTRNGDDDFEVASTPSHRSRQHTARTSSLLYLIDLLVNKSDGKIPDSVRLRAVLLMIRPCFECQNTRASKLEMLRDCATTVDSSSKTGIMSVIWEHIADLLITCLQQQQSDPNERASRSYGKEYEVVVDILGLGSTQFLNIARGQEVLLTFIDTVRKEAGKGALILAVIERVSDSIIKCTPEVSRLSCLSYTSILLNHLPSDVNRRTLEEARQILWPSSPAATRRTDFDPYNHLYDAVVSVGSLAYNNMRSDSVAVIKEYLMALRASIHHCSTSHLAVYLRKTQEVIRLWVEDPSRKMRTREEPIKGLHGEVIKLWSEVCVAIRRLPRKDWQLLLHLEPLIAAGFVSRRQSIVNISVQTWNDTFGREGSLRYPSRLEKELRSLRNHVELVLPGWEEDGETNTEQIIFYDSDNNKEELRSAVKPSLKSRARQSPFKIFKSDRRSESRSPALQLKGSKRRSLAQAAPKIRLRHDDSQIQFEPIYSSPSNPFNQESQILTERQKDMIERQRLTSGLFSDMNGPAPNSQPDHSPTELLSDPMAVEDLPEEGPRSSPLKHLANMPAMDVFVGSSPTPNARRTTQRSSEINSHPDTPTARRFHEPAVDEEIGSSPPRFEREAVQSSNANIPNITTKPDGIVRLQSETMLEENDEVAPEVQLSSPVDDTHHDVVPDGEAAVDSPMSDLPSSNIELEVTRQIEADLQAQMEAGESDVEDTAAKSGETFDDGTTLEETQAGPDDRGSDTEVDSSPVKATNQVPAAKSAPKADTSSISLVENSFIDLRNDVEDATPSPSQQLRRSSRHSQTSSPMQPPSAKKRKNTPRRRKSQANDDDEILDSIVVASPKPTTEAATSDAKSTTTGHVLVPETNRKRGVRRSQSLLSQVENSFDIVENTPAPKRARRSQGQDVSDAKAEQQPKRLSYVQVTPKRSVVEKDQVAVPEHASQASNDSQSQSAAARSFTERVILTPRSIINRLKEFKNLLFGAPQLAIGREDVREMEDVMFDIRRKVYSALDEGNEREGQQ